MKIIDISTDLLSTPVYPGDPEQRIQHVYSLENGDEYNLSAVYANFHTATHADAPSHFLEDTDTIDKLALDKFIGPVQVVALPEGPITGEIVEKYFPKNAERIILRTHPDSQFFAGAAEDVADIGYKLIGYDKPALGGNNEMAVHRALLSRGTVLLENLDLSNVNRDGEFFLIAQPIKAVGMEASFVRALLIEDYILWSYKGD